MASLSQLLGTQLALTGNNNHSNSTSHLHHHLSHRTMDRPNADPKEHMLHLMWPFTYMTQKTLHIYTHFRNQKPLFPLLCNKGILIKSFLFTCIYLWFPLLCNEDTLLLSDQLILSVGCLTRLSSKWKPMKTQKSFYGLLMYLCLLFPGISHNHSIQPSSHTLAIASLQELPHQHIHSPTQNP